MCPTRTSPRPEWCAEPTPGGCSTGSFIRRGSERIESVPQVLTTGSTRTSPARDAARSRGHDILESVHGQRTPWQAHAAAAAAVQLFDPSLEWARRRGSDESPRSLADLVEELHRRIDELVDPGDSMTPCGRASAPSACATLTRPLIRVSVEGSACDRSLRCTDGALGARTHETSYGYHRRLPRVTRTRFKR